LRIEAIVIVAWRADEASVAGVFQGRFADRQGAGAHGTPEVHDAECASDSANVSGAPAARALAHDRTIGATTLNLWYELLRQHRKANNRKSTRALLFKRKQ
jgi:hypothetical protein